MIISHKHTGDDHGTGDAENEANDKSGDDGEHWFTSYSKGVFQLELNGAALSAFLVKFAVDCSTAKAAGVTLPASAFLFSRSLEWRFGA